MVCEITHKLTKLLELPQVTITVLDSENPNDIWLEDSTNIDAIKGELLACDFGLFTIKQHGVVLGSVSVVDSEVQDFSAKLENHPDFYSILMEDLEDDYVAPPLAIAEAFKTPEGGYRFIFNDFIGSQIVTDKDRNHVSSCWVENSEPHKERMALIKKAHLKQPC